MTLSVDTVKSNASIQYLGNANRDGVAYGLLTVKDKSFNITVVNYTFKNVLETCYSNWISK
ncbi:hypothetical protein JQC92_19490 [Shewanella sp. 202IG2-18]|uniref:hypothetical protein n=1 Tax=Parashewanella hymeniacidonis TaxID=2807618 RepID=UPI0019615457|nr:hypothetical protein [Parashewanella hymeniacidonis]MBM7074185.1 hypothetical protein [Parashewanella hymeniacidonis]